MGTLTKMFIILNLVLAVAFVTISATVLSQKTTWKGKYENFKEEYEGKEGLKSQWETEKRKLNEDIGRRDKELETKQGNIKDLERDIGDFRDKVRDLEDNLTAKSKEATQEKAKADTLVQKVVSLADDLRQAKTDLADVRAKLTKANADIGDRDGTIVTLNGNVAAYKLGQRTLLTRIDGLKGQIAELEKYKQVVHAEAPTVHEHAESRATGKQIVLTERAVHAAVKAVDMKYGVVMLNVGSDTDPPVRQGVEFLVHRGGRYIAAVKVTTVDRKVCASEFIKPFPQEPVKVGDLAVTK